MKNSFKTFAISLLLSPLSLWANEGKNYIEPNEYYVQKIKEIVGAHSALFSKVTGQNIQLKFMPIESITPMMTYSTPSDCAVTVNDSNFGWRGWRVFGSDIAPLDLINYAVLHEIAHCYQHSNLGKVSLEDMSVMESEIHADIFALSIIYNSYPKELGEPLSNLLISLKTQKFKETPDFSTGKYLSAYKSRIFADRPNTDIYSILKSVDDIYLEIQSLLRASEK